MMLTTTQLAQRDGKLTASRVACLMTGDKDKIMNLWLELIGDPSFVPEDLSAIWAVQLGSHTESLNLDWYERRTERLLSRVGEVVIDPTYSWMAATLDGWDIELACPVECKHVGGFEKTTAIIERYYPQAHWQMMVTRADKCIFSIIEGAREPIIETVEYDQEYAKELFRRATDFMRCVTTLTPPFIPDPVAAPIKAEKTYDLTGNNEWASEAVTWVTTRQAAKDNAASDKAIKALVPADAAKCSGHGITVSRNKAGSLSIRENKE